MKIRELFEIVLDFLPKLMFRIFNMESQSPLGFTKFRQKECKRNEKQEKIEQACSKTKVIFN